MHRVEIETHPHVAIVIAAGELDAYAVPDLASQFTNVHGTRKVLIDLEQVSFMDSSALGLIVRAARELGESGTEVGIVLPSGPARRIFEITTLDRALPVAETRLAALEDLAPRNLSLIGDPALPGACSCGRPFRDHRDLRGCRDRRRSPS